MCHSISIKNLQHNQNHIPLNTDEQQIHDLMISLLDKIDKELNPTDTCILFDASSNSQRHLSKNSSDIDNKCLAIPQNETYLDDSLQISNDSFRPLDDYKHSLGILLDDKDDISDNFSQIPSGK
jgi:hypothetical protein